MNAYRLIMMNKLISTITFLCFFLLAGVPQLHANEKAKQTVDPIYKKLFKDSSKLRTEKGMMTVHRYEDKLYFEMPVELFKRDFLMSTVIPRSSDLRFTGTNGGVPQRYLTLERTDSLVLYKEMTHNISSNTDNPAQQKAMELSKESAIFRSFPIKGYTKDSLNVIYEVTDFFKLTNKSLVDLKKLPYSSVVFISAFTPGTETSFLNEVHAYDTSVMISNTLSAKLELNLLGLMTLGAKPDVTMDINTYLVLLPKERMKIRMANPNVGTGIAHIYDYKPLIDTKWRQIVTRRRFEKGQEMVFYTDSLMPSGWRTAITEAAEAWNKVFKEKGLGTPIRILPFPSDSTFQSQNPQLSTILLAPAGDAMRVNNITDPRTGEIISSRITVSQDIVSLIRNMGLLYLSAVDERFRTYFIPQEVVYEGIRGLALRAFGTALGLETNYAGSYAYSPQQIRSAEFTKANGFTASVMDNVLYNSIALPGDKEKGVKLVIDRVGTADALALQYLYGSFGAEEQEEETLKAFVRRHEGDPRYLYIGSTAIVPADPRASREDLGNDPIVYLQNRTANMKYFVENSPKWFKSDEVPDDFKRSLPDLVAGDYYSTVTAPLYEYIGGFYLNDVSQSSSLPAYTTVDKALQQKIVKALLKAVEAETWLNSNRELLYMGGMNMRITDYAANQGIPIRALIQRLKYLHVYMDYSKDPYTHTEFLDEIEKFLFKDVMEGKPMSLRKQALLRSFISSMTALSSSLTVVDTSNKKGGRVIADAFALTEPLSDTPEWVSRLNAKNSEVAVRSTPATPYLSLKDLTPIVYQSFERCVRMLQRSKANSNDMNYKRKMDYYLLMINNLIHPVDNKNS